LKKRIAILIHGGVGTGEFAQGFPLLPKLLGGIAVEFELEVFSHASPHPDFHSALPLWSPPSAVKGRIWRWWLVTRQLVRSHRKNPFDLVFAFWGYPAGVLGVALGKFLGLPAIVYLLGGDSTGIREINYGVMHKPIQRRIAKWAYRQAAKVMLMSRYQQHELERFGIRREYIVIPWGVDLKLYPFAPTQPSSDLTIIHVGHLTPVKDQKTLLRAFAAIREKQQAHLSIYGGDAGCYQQLADLCRQLGIAADVEFHRMVPYEDMPACYRRARLMLHTSLSEGQGLAVTEAAASGVLLCGTTTGLLYDLDESHAVRVGVGQHAQLAAQVLEILDNPEECRRRIENARKWCETHSLQWSINEINRHLKLQLRVRGNGVT
jgi:glycosyltransferase involved in cell wall biosynthesis